MHLPLINDYEFQVIQKLVKDYSGQVISPQKIYFVKERLQNLLKQEKIENPNDFLNQLTNQPSIELVQKISEAVAIHESLFFRDVHVFEFIEQKVIPTLLKRRESKKKLKIWSCGCAHGQEPYSIAMLLDELKLDDFKIEIIATDFSNHAIYYAQKGHYTNFESMRGLDERRLKKYFVKNASGYTLKEELKENISFKKHNILNPFDNLSKFDLILARNVLIYFDLEEKKKAFKNIVSHLAHDGYLIMGASETPLGIHSTPNILHQKGPCTFGY